MIQRTSQLFGLSGKILISNIFTQLNIKIHVIQVLKKEECIVNFRVVVKTFKSQTSRRIWRQNKKADCQENEQINTYCHFYLETKNSLPNTHTHTHRVDKHSHKPHHCSLLLHTPWGFRSPDSSLSPFLSPYFFICLPTHCTHTHTHTHTHTSLSALLPLREVKGANTQNSMCACVYVCRPESKHAVKSWQQNEEWEREKLSLCRKLQMFEK